MAARDYELLLKVKADLRQALGQLSKLDSGFKKNAATGERAARNLQKSFQRVGGALSNLKTIIAGAFAIREISRWTGSLVDANKQAQRINYTLEQVFGNKAGDQFKFLQRESDRLGLSLADVAEGYAQLAASAQGTGVSTRALQKTFIGMNEAATVLGTSAGDVAGVFTQLSQGISLGKLQMQDIRAIAQHLPGTMQVLQQAAKRLGTTLQDALAHGGLDAKKMLEAIGEVLHERFGPQALAASKSLNSQVNRLKTTLFLTETQGNGFASTFASSVSQLNDTLKDPGVQEGIKSLIKGLGSLISYVVKTASALAGLGSAIADTFRSATEKSYLGLLHEFDQIDGRLADLKKRRQELIQQGRSGPNALDRLSATPAFGGVAIVPGQRASDRLQTTKQLDKEIAALEKEKKAINERLAAMRKQQEKPGVSLPKVKLPKLSNALDAKGLAKLAAAQKQLGDVINSLASKDLSPAAQAWANYAKAVEQAADAGGKAIKAGANVGQVQAEVARAVQLADKARQQALDKVDAGLRSAFLKATGRQAEAVTIELHRRYDQLFKDLLGEGDKAGAELVRKLINVGTARAQLQQLEAEVQRAFEAQAQVENSVNAQVNAGLLSQYEAQQKIVAAHQQTIDKVNQLLPKMRELAAATGDPSVVAHVKAIGTQVDNLKVTANQAAQAIKNGISSAASSAVDSLVSGTATLGQAVRSFVRDIARSLAQLATNKFLDKLLNGSGSKSGGGGLLNAAIGYAASFFGGGKAGGGLISGPGTGTSDSILTPTSAGEFVTRAAVTSQAGALPFLHDFNTRGMAALRDWGSRYRGYAGGGLIGGVAVPRGPAPRLTDGGLSVMGAGRDLHQRIVVGMDSAVLDDWAKGSAFERAVKVTISRNPSHLRQILRNV